MSPRINPAIVAENLTREGATAKQVTALPDVERGPTLAPAAFSGLAGRIVQAIEPRSEADPVAILMHVLVAVGNLIGRGVHALVEETVHPCNEFVALVGATAKGRKGQAWSTPRHVLLQVDPTWTTRRIKSGLSSGEGLIYNVRDAREESAPIKEKNRIVSYERVVVDEGEPDKRLLLFEPELASVLKRMSGDTNTLSSVIRNCWDTGSLSTLTKNSPPATGAHVSIIAHITRDELVASLTATERANGFGNRFLFVLVGRSKVIAEPERVPPEILAPLVGELSGVQQWAATDRLMARTPDARALWHDVYPALSDGKPGLVGALVARGEAHVLRVSMIYAALDRADEVRAEHLTAALAVWDYAEASAGHIFGDAVGLDAVDTLYKALRVRGPMTREQIRDFFNRNKSSEEIGALLRILLGKRKVLSSMRDPDGGKGRQAEVWEAVRELPRYPR